MPSNEYRFVTDWRLEASPEEIADVLGRPEELPRWWPDVYLRAAVLDAGDSNGVGRRVALHTKGWLPYTLRWSFVVTESRYPHGFALDATGDFVGRGVWTLAADGAATDVRYDWTVRAEKPLLRILSPLLRPLFSWNHRWAMARGEESLTRELRRLRAATP